MTTPPEITIAVVEEELPGIRAYAQRHGWEVAWDPIGLRLSFTGKHPKDQAAAQVVAAVDGYRALPPAWTFEDPTGKRSGSAFFPLAGTLANGRSSIFHSNRRICAPFNRLAYQTLGGPHADWGGPDAWLEVRRPGEIRAVKIASMFAAIIGHLAVSPGMN